MEKTYTQNEKALIFLSLFDIVPQKEIELLSLFESPSALLENFFERENEINALFSKGMRNGSKAADGKTHKTVEQMKDALNEKLLS